MLSPAPVLTSKVPELPVLTAALKMYESLAAALFFVLVCSIAWSIPSTVLYGLNVFLTGC